ncbi:hypothetical protein KSF_101810 [Reticulibacter mediterranei]|uniref:Tetratricopeptide repeat protein n=1 Tax=Reticulibacter mediterranei TaxID=2778369 RepID=A0A8J3N8W9_9CHLR|nr:tetratricopeptide repeat protein [Reticulibacter mediterranei]GHP00134.1 hypothetical protein KSF_101810 [Reticulibacter mediterranei]
MDPITTAIVAALTVGAAGGLTDTAKTVVGDAYQGVKALLTKKFGTKSAVVEAVTHTATSLNNLAYLYANQGRDPEAEPLFQRAVLLSQASLGVEHPQTQQIIMNYLTLLSHLHTNGDMDALLSLLVQEEQEGHGGNEGSSE